jgi:hypothetical protein
MRSARDPGCCDPGQNRVSKRKTPDPAWDRGVCSAELISRRSALEADSLRGRAWAGLFGLEVVQPEVHGVVVLGIIELGAGRLDGFVRAGRFDEGFPEDGFGVGDTVFVHGNSREGNGKLACVQAAVGTSVARVTASRARRIVATVYGSNSSRLSSAESSSSCRAVRSCGAAAIIRAWS